MIQSSSLWIITKKKEMTSLYIDGKLTPVTLLEMPEQDVVRYKSVANDWYDSVVVWYKKKVASHKKWTTNVTYQKSVEFWYDEDFFTHCPLWSIDFSYVSDRLVWQPVHVVGNVKGRWYAWVVKRFGVDWGPETHGSKFHRHIWSLWQRKPRRVMKGHIHAWHMWTNRISIKGKKILAVHDFEWKKYFVIHWSVPGAYNSFIYIALPR